MTDKKLKEKFIEILKFNMLEPTIDPEDGNFEDHLSIQLWKFFINELAQAIAEERARVRKIIEESRWECYEHGLPNYEKTDCVECNSALETNVVLEALLSSLDKPVTKKD